MNHEHVNIPKVRDHWQVIIVSGGSMGVSESSGNSHSRKVSSKIGNRCFDQIFSWETPFAYLETSLVRALYPLLIIEIGSCENVLYLHVG